MTAMTRVPLAAATLSIALATAATAQDPDPVYQQEQKQAYRFAGDTLGRYEWTRGIPDPSGTIDERTRYRFQLRPRVELRFGPVELGVGGEFNYSEDENDVPPAGQSLLIIRDNYRSKDARLDLAWGKVAFGPFAAQGGRFFMPIPFTEMIWDRDLRPQGGAATVTLGSATSPARLALHGHLRAGQPRLRRRGRLQGTRPAGRRGDEHGRRRRGDLARGVPASRHSRSWGPISTSTTPRRYSRRSGARTLASRG